MDRETGLCEKCGCAWQLHENVHADYHQVEKHHSTLDKGKQDIFTEGSQNLSNTAKTLICLIVGFKDQLDQYATVEQELSELQTKLDKMAMRTTAVHGNEYL